MDGISLVPDSSKKALQDGVSNTLLPLPYLNDFLNLNGAVVMNI
jgi:hypothetical protein